MAQLQWEEIEHNNGFYLRRSKIHGGWLVTAISDVMTVLPDGNGIRNDQAYEWRTSITFVPDPNHEWKLDQ